LTAAAASMQQQHRGSNSACFIDSRLRRRWLCASSINLTAVVSRSHDSDHGTTMIFDPLQQYAETQTVTE